MGVIEEEVLSSPHPQHVGLPPFPSRGSGSPGGDWKEPGLCSGWLPSLRGVAAPSPCGPEGKAAVSRRTCRLRGSLQGMTKWLRFQGKPLLASAR